MFAPLKVNNEFALFCVTPVTLVPITALMSVEPVPVPEFVMVPVLLMAVVERVMPAARALLLARIKSPVPLTPPDKVRALVPAVFVKVVVPLEFIVKAPLIVNAEVVLF